MLEKIKNLSRDNRFKSLLTIFFLGPLSRWWAAIEANPTVLEVGRISFLFLISVLLISILFFIFLSSIPYLLKSSKLKFLKLSSSVIFFIFLIIGFGSFLSGITFIYGNLKLLYGGIIFSLFFYFLLEKLLDHSFKTKGINFVLLISTISIFISGIFLSKNYFEYDFKFNEPKFEINKTEGRGNALIIIFDEMSFSYYEENENGIPEFMPNLKNLAEDSNIYTKTSGTYPFTDLAIPSILNGLNTVEEFVSTNEQIDISSGPVSFLKNSHRIYSKLSILDVCDAVGCVDEKFLKYLNDSSFTVWFMDFIAIGGHILPHPLPSLFPSLDGTWRDYWEIDKVEEKLETALTPLDSQGEWFYLYHDEVTHHPWNLDSEGKAISPKANRHFREFLFPECIGQWRVLCSKDRISLRREIFKNGLIEADRRIGDFVNFLRETNQYENTLIVVTSDHGIVMDGEGDGRRPSTLERLRPLAHVPLVVKFPGQSETKVIDEIKSTGQIIPTVVKSIGDSNAEILIPDLSMPLPPESRFLTEGGDLSVDMKKIFNDTSPPIQVNSEIAINPWISSKEINSNNKEISVNEGIVGYGTNSRKGPSDTAAMAWFIDSNQCFGDVLVKHIPTSNTFYTLFDSSEKESLVWSLVIREQELKIEDYILYCSDKN